MLKMFKFVVLICLFSTAYCVPVDNTINNSDSIDINDKVSAVKLEETTTNGQLFNNNDGPEEDKIFKLNDDELVEISNLSPSSKQASATNIPNLQSLIEQSNTIQSNLNLVISDNEKNKRSTILLTILQANVVRLNRGLVNLNERVNKLSTSIGGGSSASSSTTSSASSASTSAASSNPSQLTVQAATNINKALNNLRSQIAKISGQFNDTYQSVVASLPGTGSSNKPSNKPTTRKP